ncbi:MAG: hypothetical protein ACRC37_05035 [Lentisphaeria bacterium]
MKVGGSFSRPSGIAFSPLDNSYYIANNLMPSQQRNNDAFITLLRFNRQGVPFTDVIIKGGENSIVLNAPKGIVYFNDSIYVADIDTIRIFVPDGNTWVQSKEIIVSDAAFLNQMVVLKDKTILVTDTVRNCVYKISYPYGNGSVQALLTNVILQPTGLAVDEAKQRLWIGAYRTGSIFEVSLQNNKVVQSYRLRVAGVANIFYNEDDGSLLASDSLEDKVYSLRLNNKVVERETINEKVLKRPTGIFLDPVSGMILISEAIANQLTIFKNKEINNL